MKNKKFTTISVLWQDKRQNNKKKKDEMKKRKWIREKVKTRVTDGHLRIYIDINITT